MNGKIRKIEYRSQTESMAQSNHHPKNNNEPWLFNKKPEFCNALFCLQGTNNMCGNPDFIGINVLQRAFTLPTKFQTPSQGEFLYSVVFRRFSNKLPRQ